MHSRYSSAWPFGQISQKVPFSQAVPSELCTYQPFTMFRARAQQCWLARVSKLYIYIYTFINAGFYRVYLGSDVAALASSFVLFPALLYALPGLALFFVENIKDNQGVAMCKWRRSTSTCPLCP